MKYAFIVAAAALVISNMALIAALVIVTQILK